MVQYALCENSYDLCLWQYQGEWFTLYHTNLSHEVPLSFVWLKFSSFGWDIDMRRIRNGKTLSLGMPKAPQGNIQGRLKYLSLGMPRKASPLSSSKTIGIPYSELYFYSSHDMCFAWSVFSILLAVWIKSLDLKSWMKNNPPMAS